MLRLWGSMLFTAGDDGEGDDGGDDGMFKRFGCFAFTVPCLSCFYMMLGCALLAAAVAFPYTSPDVPDRSFRISPVELSLLHLCCGCGVLCFSQPETTGSEVHLEMMTPEMTVSLNVSVAYRILVLSGLSRAFLVL